MQADLGFCLPRVRGCGGDLHSVGPLIGVVLVAQSSLTSATLRTVAHQAPLSMGFSRQEQQTGMPFPTRGDLPDPGVEPASPLFTCIGRRALLPLVPPEKSHPSLLKEI